MHEQARRVPKMRPVRANQEIVALRMIMAAVRRLSQASRDWLIARLVADEEKRAA